MAFPPGSDDPWMELLAHGPAVILRWTGSPGVLTYVSPNFSTVFGLDSVPYLGGQALLEDRIHEDDRLVFREVREAFSGRLRFLDGKDRWRQVDHRTVLIPGAPGREQTVLAYWLDATEAESLARRYTLALGAARTSTWELDNPGGRIRVDSLWSGLTGYSPGELTDLTLDKVQTTVHPHDLDLWLRTRAQVHTSGQAAFDLELRLIIKSGLPVWFRIRGRVTETDRDGHPVQILGTLENISEAVLSKEEKAVLTQVVEQGPGAVILTDTDGNIEYVNRQFTVLSGYPLEEVRGKNPRFLKHPDTLAQTHAELWATITAGQVWSGEFQNRRKDGTSYWVQASISPVTDPAGRVTRYAGQQIDITPRKTIEAAAVAQYRFQLFLTRASARLVQTGQDGFPEALQEILGDLGRHFGADRAKMGFLSADGRTLRLAGGWYRTGPVLPPEVSLEGYPGWTTRLNDREPLVAHGPCRVPWSDQPAAGLVTVPLDGGTGEPGCLFLEAWTPRPSWNTEVQVSLMVVANTLSAFLKRTAAEEKLRQAQADADRANQAKSDFLAQMSHEIRTPMNGVMGLAELALEQNLAPETRSLVEGIQACGRTLLALVNDILDLSKIEAGKVDLEDLIFSLGTVLGETLAPLQVMADKKGVTLSVVMAPALPDLRKGDPHRLRQILTNLLGNAVKFTPRGPVTLEVAAGARETDAGLLKFSVRDSGPGVPPDKRHRLFQRFTQTESSTARLHGGTGLGLAICRELTLKMGGSIGYADSPAPPGAVFWFTAHLPAARPTDQCLCGPEPDRAFQEKVRVLVVEDNLVNQKVVQGLLRTLGVAPVLASNGVEALDYLVNGAFDLVFMDVEMPALDGMATTRAIRRGQGGDRHRTVPVAAMTANAMEGDREACLAAGMDDYVTKPLSTHELARVVDRWALSRNTVPKERARLTFDPEELRLRLPLGDQALQEILGLFLADLPARRQALTEALVQRDLGYLVRLAHTLKGTSANLVAQGVSDAAFDLETAAREGRTSDLGPLMADLFREISFLEKALGSFPASEF